MSLSPSDQCGRATLAVRKDDLYETPAVAVQALMRVEKLPHRLWECAAGRGAIVDVLRAGGHEVLASDLVDYDCPTHFTRRDFLMEHKAPDRCEAIITNPPFKLADQFARHALSLCPLVIMLLRLAYLEGQRRIDVLESSGLARVHVFRNRLPMMHRDSYSRTSRQGSSAIPFAWFVWDRDHIGPTELRRLSWEAA